MQIEPTAQLSVTNQSSSFFEIVFYCNTRTTALCFVSQPATLFFMHFILLYDIAQLFYRERTLFIHKGYSAIFYARFKKL